MMKASPVRAFFKLISGYHIGSGVYTGQTSKIKLEDFDEIIIKRKFFLWWDRYSNRMYI